MSGKGDRALVDYNTSSTETPERFACTRKKLIRISEVDSGLINDMK